jgi:16S rRNA (cytosine1402-N4)-methyltransferase
MPGEFKHKPVMLKECIKSLAIRKDGTYVDCTLGGGGHSKEILKRLGSKGLLIGIDQDEEAIKAATQNLAAANLNGNNAKLIIEKTNFENLDTVIERNNVGNVDGILIDLGVSSHQLDTKERGFSYNYDAPLDMRMDRDKEITAYDILNGKSSQELFEIIRDYGEEKWAKRIAEFIVQRRDENKMNTTFELVDAIKSAIPKKVRREGGHPAKRTFQAIRIYINNELEILSKALLKAVNLLNEKGRLVIITFHSLEDRLVKNAFAKFKDPCECPKSFPVCVCGKKPLGEIITRKPILPGKNELEENPRARSAKLRVFEKR